MEYYLALLLFVFPGFFINKLKIFLSVYTEEKDQFKIIINSLSINILILVINYYIITIFSNSIGINLSVNFKTFFENINFNHIIIYFWITLLSTLIMGIIIILTEIKFGKIINKIRNRMNLSSLDSNNLVWDELVQKKLNPVKSEFSKVVEVIVHGKTVERGFLEIANTSLYGKELIINNIKLAKELKDNYTNLDSIYVDFENNIIIKLYSYEEK